jgi:hypothetical protein
MPTIERQASAIPDLRFLAHPWALQTQKDCAGFQLGKETGAA